MNREIKFRAWDVRKKQMIHFNAFKRWGFINHELEPGVSGSFGGGEISLSTDPQYYEWMQYTGLKDRNGVEIYEGDIVRVRGRKRIGVYHTAVVHKGAGFYLDRNDTYLVDDKAWLNIEAVIGNIYEHPNLLEQSSPSETQ